MDTWGCLFFVLFATSAQQTGKEFTLTVYRRFPVNDDYTDSPGGQTLKEAYASFFFSLRHKLLLGKTSAAFICRFLLPEPVVRDVFTCSLIGRQGTVVL
jgi:hypothetical protein